MPIGLPKAAKEEWLRIVPRLLEIGVLSAIDGPALACYCCSFCRWLQAEKQIARTGIVLPDGRKNPAVTVSETEMKIMKSFLIEFGMTPASRCRLAAKPEEERSDASESYFQIVDKQRAKRRGAAA